MSHKPECAKTKDPNAACSLNCEAPQTQICPECEQEIGASETVCPKCKTDITLAKAEMDVVERNLTRVAKKRKREKKPPAAPPTTEPEKKHPFAGLASIFGKKS